MANIKELSAELKSLSHTKEDIEKRIEITFKIMKLYARTQKRTKSDEAVCINAALALSVIVQKGLGAKTRKFLETYNGLPDRVYTILQSSILRMEGY